MTLASHVFKKRHSSSIQERGIGEEGVEGGEGEGVAVRVLFIPIVCVFIVRTVTWSLKKRKFSFTRYHAPTNSIAPLLTVQATYSQQLIPRFEFADEGFVSSPHRRSTIYRSKCKKMPEQVTMDFDFTS